MAHVAVPVEVRVVKAYAYGVKQSFLFYLNPYRKLILLPLPHFVCISIYLSPYFSLSLSFFLSHTHTSSLSNSLTSIPLLPLLLFFTFVYLPRPSLLHSSFDISFLPSLLLPSHPRLPWQIISLFTFSILSTQCHFLTAFPKRPWHYKAINSYSN